MGDRNPARLIFILGGARAGKSYFAQELAAQYRRVLFVATGEALDEEMKERIKRHRKARPTHWRTLELPRGLGQGIRLGIGDAEVVLVDCLTLLVSNVLCAASGGFDRVEKQVMEEIGDLIKCADELSATFILVANEVGLGIVPENETARLFRDLLGKVNQIVAARADEVYLLFAGIRMKVKEFRQ